MIKIGARQHYNTARLLRRLSTSKDHARPRATLDSRRIVQSPLPNPDSACPDWSTRLVASSVAFQTSI
jgi:hypothetical protein